jgi:hypothetical protein
MPKLKITTVGASAGIILNKEVMARLRVKRGDLLFLTEAPRRFPAHALPSRIRAK